MSRKAPQQLFDSVPKQDGQIGPWETWRTPGENYAAPRDPAFERAVVHRREAKDLARDLVLMQQIEQEHLARREAATTDDERAAADGLLEDIRTQIAATSRRYRLVKVSKDGAALRDEWQAKVREIADALKASQHEGYTPEYRDAERQRLNAEFQRTTDTYRALIEQWYEQQRTAAQAAYETEPAGDTATEVRRLRFRDEVRSLVEEYAADGAGRTKARNILLPEAKRLAALGAVERAHVLAEAARRLGAQDGNLDTQIKEHLDRTVPHRRAAIEALQAVEGELTTFRIEAVKARAVHGFGTPAQQTVARENANFLEWKKQREDALLAQQNGEQVIPLHVDPEDVNPPAPARSA